ncbi:MAG: hypothetical protein MJY63_04685 [Paludibacteraceae bacterium]|nr:hypothetical protein [Paludibacteraceae bacterium]
MKKTIMTLVLLFIAHISAFAADKPKKADEQILPTGIEAFFVFPNSDEIFLGGDIKINKLLTAESISSRVQFAKNVKVRPIQWDTLKYTTQEFSMRFLNQYTGDVTVLESKSGKITEEMKNTIKENGSTTFYVSPIIVLGQYDGVKRTLPPIEVRPKK